MKVYVIIRIYSDYEPYSIMDSIWANAQDAEEHKGLLIANNTKAKEQPPPYKTKDYMRNNLSDKQEDEYYQWSIDRDTADEFKEPIIQEMGVRGAR